MSELDELFDGVAEKFLKIIDKVLDKVGAKVDDEAFLDNVIGWIKENVVINVNKKD